MINANREDSFECFSNRLDLFGTLNDCVIQIGPVIICDGGKNDADEKRWPNGKTFIHFMVRDYIIPSSAPVDCISAFKNGILTSMNFFLPKTNYEWRDHANRDQAVENVEKLFACFLFRRRNLLAQLCVDFCHFRRNIVLDNLHFEAKLHNDSCCSSNEKESS